MFKIFRTVRTSSLCYSNTWYVAITHNWNLRTAWPSPLYHSNTGYGASTHNCNLRKVPLSPLCYFCTWEQLSLITAICGQSGLVRNCNLRTVPLSPLCYFSTWYQLSLIIEICGQSGLVRYITPILVTEPSLITVTYWQSRLVPYATSILGNNYHS